MRQEWVRSLFEGFTASKDLRKARGDMPKHVSAYAAFFTSIGERFSSAGELSQDRLLAAYGAEGLRRQFQAVRFIATRLSLDWSGETTERVTEQARVGATLSRYAYAPWAADLAAYCQSLRGERPISPRTERMYVAAAAELLVGSGVERASALTDALVMRHLRRKPGQGANLARFLTWLEEAAGSSFARRPKLPTAARKREKAILERSAALLTRLEVVSEPREGRALLAAAIASVYGVPLLHILVLRPSNVSNSHGLVRLLLARGTVTLNSHLANAFIKFAAARGAYTFIGRSSMQPLSAAAVNYRLRPLITK